MDSQDPVVVVMASDDNYAQHMGVAALSVADRCSAPKRLVFHFLDAGISARNVERLKTLVSAAGAQCVFVTPNLDRYRDFPMLRYGVGAYLRLSMGSLLPESVERALYLDCDVLAFDDVARLWHTDLQGRTLAAVGNLGHQGTSASLYFNSGVLLIDLKQWRSSGVEKKLMAYLDSRRDALRYPDQDALNAVFEREWLPLRLRWNQQPATYSMAAKGLSQAPHAREEFEEAVRCPGVVHYLGKNKPWDYMTFHPLKEFYWYYLEQSDWRGAAYRGRSIATRLRKALMVQKWLKRIMRQRLGPTIPHLRHR